MIGSQTTRPRCSHLKQDDVATPACPFVLVSRSVCLSVCLCMQTDTPPTDRGNAISWGGKWTTGSGRVNDPCQKNWLPCPTQWWRHTSSDRLKMIPIQQSVFDAVPLAMQAYLYVVYRQHWIDKSLYCATFELYQASVVTDSHRLRACVRSLCESVTTLTT